MTEPQSQIAIYQTADGQIQIEVCLQQETVWLRQEQMGELFGRERSVITKHIRNVFSEGELDEKSNVQNLHIAGSDKPVKFYNLDVIISVGYRVKSQQRHAIPHLGQQYSQAIPDPRLCAERTKTARTARETGGFTTRDCFVVPSGS